MNTCFSQSPPNALNRASTSSTWTSRTKREQDQFRRIQTSTRHFFGDKRHLAPVPQTFPDWLRFREEVKLDTARRERRAIASRTLQSTSKLLAPFRGKTYADARGAILAHPTIWCPAYSANPSKFGGFAATVWPSRKELRYEGEDRAFSPTGDFRRFMPLVRDWCPGDDLGMFDKVRPLAPVSDFDVVWKTPGEATEGRGEMGLDAGSVERFIGKELLGCIADE